MRAGILAFAAVLAAPAAPAGETVLRSGPARVALLELYSSEGCSSCPPADRWVSGLLERPGLWADFVPVVFHVDYWDSLGWKDRLAAPAHAARQRLYARAWGARTVYTPGAVLDGSEFRAWGGRLPASRGAAGILEARVAADRSLAVSYSAPEGEEGPWTAHAALLGFGLESRVTRGENAGRLLEHDFVVLDHRQAPLSGASARLRLRASPGLRARRLGVAVWAARAGELAPRQACGGFLD